MGLWRQGPGLWVCLVLQLASDRNASQLQAGAGPWDPGLPQNCLLARQGQQFPSTAVPVSPPLLPTSGEDDKTVLLRRR